MVFEKISTAKGTIAVLSQIDEPLDNTGSFLDVMASAPTRIVAIEKKYLCAEFFDLKTGLAGDFLQKVSNYQWKLIIYGDFSTITSKSLGDFIYESNQTGHVVFEASLASGIERLK